MLQLALKGVISGLVVVAASEAARRSSIWAAILVSLPLTSMLALGWLYADTRDAGAVADLSWAILLVVAPSVIFFVALPLLIRWGLPVPVSMLGASIAMIAGYVGYAWFVARFFGTKLA